MTPQQIGLLILAYVLGAIPFGVIVARQYGVDILKVGSGNSGATNVWRTLGKVPGTAVFLLDVLKGFVPSALMLWLSGRVDLAFLAGFIAILGHSFSPFIKFKGGKGIATGLGMFLGSAPLVGLSAFSVFIVVVALTRFISLGSIIAALSLPIFGAVFHNPPVVIVGEALLALFIVYRHRANIIRLRSGTESKFDIRGRSKPTQPVESSKESEMPHTQHDSEPESGEFN